MKKKIIIGVIILALVVICYFIINSPKNNYEKKYNRFILNKEYKEDLKNDYIYNSTFFYSIYDLDNDDIPEMVIRVKTDDEFEIYALYKLKDNKVTYIDTIYSRETIKYNKTANAITYNIYNRNASSITSYEIVAIENDSLKTKDRISYIVDDNNYKYYSGLTKKDYKSITKEEYDQFINNNVELEYISITK